MLLNQWQQQLAINVPNIQAFNPDWDVLPFSSVTPLAPCVQIRLDLWLNDLHVTYITSCTSGDDKPLEDIRTGQQLLTGLLTNGHAAQQAGAMPVSWPRQWSHT